MSMYIWVSSCSLNVYTGYNMNISRESQIPLFFFLVPHLEDKVLLKLKRPCFAVAWLIRCSVLGRKGQMLRWKGGKEPMTLGDRER